MGWRQSQFVLLHWRIGRFKAARFTPIKILPVAHINFLESHNLIPFWLAFRPASQ